MRASTGQVAHDVVTRRIFREFVELFNSMFLALAAPCARTFREPAGATLLEMELLAVFGLIDNAR